MKYTVQIGVDGYVFVEVDTANTASALKEAEKIVSKMEFLNNMEDVELRPVWITDENKNEEILG